MSYLMRCERLADAKRGTDREPRVNSRFAVQWRSVKGQVEVNPRAPQDTVIFYKRYTRLANLITLDHESECYYIAQGIRKALSLPPETTFRYMAGN